MQPTPTILPQGLAQASDAEVAAAIASAKISRALKLEKPLHALLTLADSASVGADPAKAAAALDGVTAAAVKKAAAEALKSGMSMASVGNITEVRVCVCARERSSGGWCCFSLSFSCPPRASLCFFSALLLGGDALLLLV